jgi:hypothetical protein
MRGDELMKPIYFGTNFPSSEQDLLKLINANNIYSRNQIEVFDKFNRFGYLDPFNGINNTKEYTFFTKPDLHIFNNGDPYTLNPELQNIPIFVDALDRYRNVLKQLQVSNRENRSPFINLLSAKMKTNIDLPSINAGESDTSATIYGSKLFYRKSSFASDQEHEFSVEFEDTDRLDVYMFFKLYDEYERLKKLGTVTPPSDVYVRNRWLHDQFAAYKIIVDEDYERIIFFAKLLGVFPKGAPREIFSDISANGGLRMTVNFRATFVEDMNPVILSEFDYICKPYYKNIANDADIYDLNAGRVNGDWVTIPRIAKKYNNYGTARKESEYLLKWR